MGRDGLPHAVGQNVGWATAWQSSPARQPACAACCALRERRRSHHARDGALACSKVARRWLDGGEVLLETLRGSRGRCRARRAHRNGGSTVRRRERRRATSFIGGEGALVGGDGGCGVLQHRRSKGVRKMQEIAGIRNSWRSSPGSGGRRRCSAGIREGEWAAGGRRWRSRCGERWGGSGAREEGSERNGDGRTSGAA
jgi:hypothetical protein